jgi:hypothetical protein
MKTHHLAETESAIGEVIRRFELDMNNKHAFPKPRALTLEVLIIIGTHGSYKKPITLAGIQQHTKKKWSSMMIGRAIKEAALFLGYYNSPIELRRRSITGEPWCRVHWLFIRDDA